MKLVRWGSFGAERPGVVNDNGDVVDVSAIIDDYDGAFFSGNGMDTLRKVVAAGDLTLVPDGTRLGPPVGRPQAVFAIGLNYADHARESGMEPPSEPVVFTKLPNTLCGPNDDVVIPRGSVATDYEVELAVVIGRRAHYLADPAASRDHIAGFCLANDVSERDHQLERGGQWIKGKANRNFSPLGPWLVTPDEIADVQQLRLRLDVNGEQRQSSTTAEMIFSVDHIVWYLSQFMVLEAGDVIVTGTPPGVGMGFDPPRYLSAGDVVELEIEGLGVQCSNVVDEST